MKSIILAIGIILLFSSCEKLLFENEITNNPKENFEYLWKECDEKYSLFRYKNVDWDAVYDVYASLIYEGMTDDSLFNVFSAMLKELRDGHVTLKSPYNTFIYIVELKGPKNFDVRLLADYYLTDDYYRTGSFAHKFLAEGKIGYIRYWSFGNAINNDELDFILSRYSDTEGLILDLRVNGGGSLSNVFKLLNRFTKEKILIYNLICKNGPGHEDFHEAQPAYAVPTGSVQYTKKVAVLVDRGSYSATSCFSLGVKALPNTFLVGDTTGGGLGFPRGGQLPNGWLYTFSIARWLTPDGICYENGIPPDVYVILDKDDVENGVDTVIERAIQEILNLHRP